MLFPFINVILAIQMNRSSGSSVETSLPEIAPKRLRFYSLLPRKPGAFNSRPFEYDLTVAHCKNTMRVVENLFRLRGKHIA